VKRLLGCLAIGSILVATTPVLVANADPTAKKVAVAPADEYFGKMKMSILGIRNEIHDLTLKIGYEPAKAESFLGIANQTEDALTDWERKYPDDPWIPKTLFALGRMYSVVRWSNEMNARAKRVMLFLHEHYAATWYGKQALQEIAEGRVGKVIPTPPPAVDPPPSADTTTK